MCDTSSFYLERLNQILVSKNCPIMNRTVIKEEYLPEFVELFHQDKWSKTIIRIERTSYRYLAEVCMEKSSKKETQLGTNNTALSELMWIFKKEYGWHNGAIGESACANGCEMLCLGNEVYVKGIFDRSEGDEVIEDNYIYRITAKLI